MLAWQWCSDADFRFNFRYPVFYCSWNSGQERYLRTWWSQCHTHSAICNASICRTVVPELVKAAPCWTWCIPHGSGSDSCAVIVWWSSTGSNKMSEGVLIGLHVDYWYPYIHSRCNKLLSNNSGQTLLSPCLAKAIFVLFGCHLC